MNNDIIEIARILVARENLVPEIDMYDFLSDAEKEPYITMAKMLNPENHKELIRPKFSEKDTDIICAWETMCEDILNNRDIDRKSPINLNIISEVTTIRAKIIAYKEKLFPINTAPRDGTIITVLIWKGGYYETRFNGSNFVHNTLPGVIAERIMYGWKYCD